MQMTCAKAISLPCPCCGEESANIAVRLGWLDQDEAFQCLECDAEFGITQINDLIRKWSLVVAWVVAAPHLDAE